MISPTGFWNITGSEFEHEHCYDDKLGHEIVSVLKDKRVATMYDFGCGHGKYTMVFNLSGMQCTGFDGNPVTSTFPFCKVQDLTDSTFRLPEVDCVMCLEVAEHVPKEFESRLVDTIDVHTKKGGLVILSWAVPGQGGLGHVNCQTNEYVKDLFVRRGYTSLDSISSRLRNASSLPWFKHTIFVFQKTH